MESSWGGRFGERSSCELTTSSSTKLISSGGEGARSRGQKDFEKKRGGWGAVLFKKRPGGKRYKRGSNLGEGFVGFGVTFGKRGANWFYWSGYWPRGETQISGEEGQ